MKRFIGFLIKEFYHILRDPRTIIILFGMPIVQVILFAYVITNEIKDAEIAILDHAKDNVTTKIIRKMLSSGYFQLNKSLKYSDEIEECFREGDVKMAIIFESGFARRLQRENKANVQIIADASDPNTAKILVNYASGIIRDYVQREQTTRQAHIQIIPQVRMHYNEQLKGVYMFVPGIMSMILMLVSAMMTSISITREKEIGTMEVLLVSPLQPVQIILGKVTPYLLLSFINAIVIIALGNFVFGVPIQGSLVLLLAESMLFILLALSLGIFISTVTNNQQTAMMLSMFALMLPTILLSGFIFPVENMPVILQWIAYFMPPYWYVIIIKNIMLKGLGIIYVWQGTCILAAMTVFFIVLSIKKFKIRLE